MKCRRRLFLRQHRRQSPRPKPKPVRAAVAAVSAHRFDSRADLAQLVGYLPKRGDFDIEYDNDAELMLADMEFKACSPDSSLASSPCVHVCLCVQPDDTKQERDLKFRVLQIYNAKLDARAERKRFIVERGLLEQQEKPRTKEERQIEESMRVFARFHSKEEHVRLARSRCGA